jgi:hypothetical protein
VKSFDAAVKHFGKSGEFRDVFDRNARVAEEFGSASCRDQLDAEGGEVASKVDESGFIGH